MTTRTARKLGRILTLRAPSRGQLVPTGPFIGDTRSDLARSYERYRAGAFQRI